MCEWLLSVFAADSIFCSGLRSVGVRNGVAPAAVLIGSPSRSAAAAAAARAFVLRLLLQ